MNFEEEKEMMEKLVKKAHAFITGKRCCFVPCLMDIRNRALYFFDAECYDISYKGAEHGMVSADRVKSVLDDLKLAYRFGADVVNSVQIGLLRVYKGFNGEDDGQI